MTEHMFDPDGPDRASLDAEFHTCNLQAMPAGTVAGLFAGIGGIELGLARYGFHPELLCENWEPANAVLRKRFPGVPVAGDIRSVRSLPEVDVVTAGFPCTDLSQAGRTRGIGGEHSGLVAEVFRLLRQRRAPALLLENVRNMLVLDGGRGMRYLVDELEALGYRWAYRLVDSRFTGVPQRRQRVIFLAALELDPRAVLLADEAGERSTSGYSEALFGFYWTEGLRGLGWARDAVPTLKGGSTLGIPSPPAIWWPHGRRGQRLVVPRIDQAEKLQGFRAGWTAPADRVSSRTRWKLVGNAVTVGVARWVAKRLAAPGDPILAGKPLSAGDPWPISAWGAKGKAWAADVSMWPHQRAYRHLDKIVDPASATPLSERAAAGFLERARRGNLNFVPGFLDDVEAHVEYLRGARAVA